MERPSAPMSVHDVPVDLWVLVQRDLDAVDIVNLGLTCKDMYAKMTTVIEECGQRVPLAHASQAKPLVRDLVVVGKKCRFFGRRPDTTGTTPLRLPPLLPRLRSLELLRPAMAQGLWRDVFDGCPELRIVKVQHEFCCMEEYAADANSYLDLLQLGVPRLHTLELEAAPDMILILSTTKYVRGSRDGLVALLQRMKDVGTLVSNTLRRYKPFQQLPVPVDADLDHLSIDDSFNHEVLLPRMPPRVRRVVRTLDYTCHTRAFESMAHELAHLRALASLDLTLTAPWRCPLDISKAIKELSALPTGLRTFRLRLKVWYLNLDKDDEIVFGSPLSGLSRLESLHIECQFPPTNVEALLGTWMGAGPTVTDVTATFLEPDVKRWDDAIDRAVSEHGGDVDFTDPWFVHHLSMREHALRQVDDTPLRGFLDARPRCWASLRGLSTVLRCSHPRCSVL